MKVDMKEDKKVFVDYNSLIKRKHDMDKIYTIVDEIESGEYGCLLGQRNYVWYKKSRDIAFFIDSIYRNYDVGKLTLLSVENYSKKNKSLASVNSNSNNDSTIKFKILDGQQRMTTLHAIFCGKPIKGDDKKFYLLKVFFNPAHIEELRNKDDEEFIQYDTSDIAEENIENENIENETLDTKNDSKKRIKNSDYFKCLKIEINSDSAEDVSEGEKAAKKIIFNTSNYKHPWVDVVDIYNLKYRGTISKYKDTFEKYPEKSSLIEENIALAEKQFREYEIGKTIISLSKDGSLQLSQISEMFIRLNNKGIKFSQPDLLRSLLADKWEDFITETDRFKENMKEHKIPLKDETILKVLNLFYTNNPSNLHYQRLLNSINGDSIEAIKEAWNKTKKYIEKSLQTMTTEFGMKFNVGVSEAFIITFSYYYYLKDIERRVETNNDNIYLLKYWFYTSYIDGLFSNKRGSDRLLKVLKKLQNKVSFRDIINEFPKTIFTPKDFEVKYTSTLYNAIILMGSEKNKFRNWEDGNKLSNTWYLNKDEKKEDHHIFPAAFLRKSDDTIQDSKINQIANITPISSKMNKEISANSPNIYLNKYKTSHSMIESHFIDIDKTDTFDIFIEDRKNKLSIFCNEFLNELLINSEKVEKKEEKR